MNYRSVLLSLISALALSHAAVALSAPVSAAVSAPASVPDNMKQRVAACVACHSLEGQATRDGYFPRIAGKPAGYLFNQLQNFRDGQRQFPLMTYTVSHLSDDYLREMATYFSGLQVPYPPPPPATVSAAVLERGRVLAVSGDQGRKIPACASCHGARLTGVAPAIPGLVGLPRDYLNSQFGAWRNGSRRAARPDCMAQISSALSIEDISAVSAWLAAQPVPANSAPEPALLKPLPIECGSAAPAPLASKQGAAR